jgi:hypothetical protein
MCSLAVTVTIQRSTFLQVRIDTINAPAPAQAVSTSIEQAQVVSTSNSKHHS